MRLRNIVLLSLWMSGALLSFSGVAVALRSLGRTLNIFEMLAFRNATGIIILLGAAALHARWRAEMRPIRPGLHLVRNAAHYAGQYAWSYGVLVLPLATVFALEFTAPIWLAILAVALLGERMTGPRAGAIVLGFIGVFVILRPGQEAFQLSSILVLLSAFAFAVTAVASKALTRSVPTFTILLWMNLMQLGPNLAGSDPFFLNRIEQSQIPALLVLTIGGISSHLCQTQAYRHGDAIVVMPLDFLRIPLIALVGWQLYGEPLDVFVFAGAGIIVAGILWNLSAEARGAPEVSASRTPGSGPGS